MTDIAESALHCRGVGEQREREVITLRYVRNPFQVIEYGDNHAYAPHHDSLPGEGRYYDSLGPRYYFLGGQLPVMIHPESHGRKYRVIQVILLDRIES